MQNGMNNAIAIDMITANVFVCLSVCLSVSEQDNSKVVKEFEIIFWIDIRRHIIGLEQIV